MTTPHEILEGSTQTIVLYPPSGFLGAPTTPRVRVHTPSTPLPDDTSWEVATTEGISVATSAASAEGDDELTFASDPGLTPGYKYLLDVGNGLVVTALDTGTTVKLESPLLSAVPLGAGLVSLAVTHALTADETRDRGAGFVLVDATLLGQTVAWTEMLEIRAYMIGAPLTSDELLKAWPPAKSMLPTSDETGEETINAAWQFEVLPEVRARGIQEELIINLEVLVPALVGAIRYRILRDYKPDDTEQQSQALESLQREYTRAFASSDWWQKQHVEQDQPPKDPPKRAIKPLAILR